MLELEFDEKKGLLTRRMSGFWTLDNVTDYVSKVEALIARIKRTHPDFRTLADARQMPTQSIEVTNALTVGMKTLTIANPGRVAILASGALAKLQIERRYPYPHVRVFLDEQSARAWLFEDPTEGAP